jgi:hypothetical protein
MKFSFVLAALLLNWVFKYLPKCKESSEASIFKIYV